MSIAEKRVGELRGRLAELKDIERIEQIVQFAFRGGTDAKSWTGEEHLVRGPRITLDGLRTILAEPKEQAILLAELPIAGSIEIVGCIHVEKHEEDAHIGMLAVAPAAQSSGTGKFLMDWAEEFAQRQFDCKRVVGVVLSGRPELMDWYLRKGFELTGEIEPYNPPGVTPLVDGLHFVKIQKALR